MMPDPSERHVFVYGTLRRGGRNDINRLVPTPQYVGIAEVRGVLYPLGWYPGLVLGGPGAGPVVGEVYAIAPALEPVLDAVEAIEPHAHSEYFKREIVVRVAGRALTCLVYEVNPDRIVGRTPIHHGDWMQFHPS